MTRGVDEVRSLFEASAAAIAVPQGDVAAVVGRGRRRQTFAAALTAVASAVVIAGAWGLVAAIDSSEGEPRPPAAADDLYERHYQLVPTEGTGPEPPAGNESALEDARAVTVAFHALLERVGYELDYKNVVRVGGAWEVSFLDHAEKREQEASLQALLDRIVASQAGAAKQLDHARETRRHLESEARDLARSVSRRARHVRERAETVGRKARMLQRRIAELEREFARITARLEEQQTAGFARVMLRVVRSGPRLVVERVDVVPAGERSYEAVVGYAERVEDVDVLGADYYDGRFEKPGAPGDSPGFDVRGFWTGPIPSPYEERCVGTLVEFRGGGGEVWRQASSGHFPPPPTIEDERDGWSVGYAIDHDGSFEGLSPLLRCRWRPVR